MDKAMDHSQYDWAVKRKNAFRHTGRVLCAYYHASGGQLKLVKLTGEIGQVDYDIRHPPSRQQLQKEARRIRKTATDNQFRYLYFACKSISREVFHG